MEKLPRTQMGKVDFMKLTDMPPTPVPTKRELREERKAQKELERSEKEEKNANDKHKA